MPWSERGSSAWWRELPADQRRVIELRFGEERSTREIAAELGRTEGAVKQLQLRAVHSLRKRMRKTKMPRRSRSDDLDRAVEAILAGREPEPLASDEELSALVGLAAVLRDLPRAAFRAQLSGALLHTIESKDLREAVKDLPALELRRLGASTARRSASSASRAARPGSATPMETS